MPVVSELSPMKIGESSISRVRSTVREIWPGSLNRVTNVGTTIGASSHITAENATRSTSRAFSTLEATCQASSSRSRARYPVNTGMNADASAPATRRPKIASGILNAAMNASRSGEPPNVAPSTESRSQPRTRLATSVPIMIADARATDIGTELILRHPLSFAADGNKETQALGPETHPADPAPHHRQDDRPLRGADGRAHGTRGDREGRRSGCRRDRGGCQRARPRGKAWRDPQEQRAPSPQPDRESQLQGEEEELGARDSGLRVVRVARRRGSFTKRGFPGDPPPRHERSEWRGRRGGCAE